MRVGKASAQIEITTVSKAERRIDGQREGREAIAETCPNGRHKRYRDRGIRSNEREVEIIAAIKSGMLEEASIDRRSLQPVG